MGYSRLNDPDCARHQWLEKRKKRARDVDAAQALVELHDNQVKCVCQGNSDIAGVACQTEDTEDKLRAELKRVQRDNQLLKSDIADMKFCGAQHNLTPNALKEDPQLLRFYTGIPDWTVFMALYNLVYQAIPTTPVNKLSKFSIALN